MSDFPFSGLCAFPLTPLKDGEPDEEAVVRIVGRAVSAGVDSLGVLGSTGVYPYLNRRERAAVARRAVDAAGSTPVMVGIGALRTRDVCLLAEDAQNAGASAVLLAPVSYHSLTEDEVFHLYRTVSASLSVPLCLYDNPGTTKFTFSDELYRRIAELPMVYSIKIPGISPEMETARARVATLRKMLPPDVTIGISGDSFAATGLIAGCDLWYSVIGGLFPRTALAIARSVRMGEGEEAMRLSRRLGPLWTLFQRYGGSLRVIATAAEVVGFAASPSLPLPLTSIEGEERRELALLLERLDVT